MRKLVKGTLALGGAMVAGSLLWRFYSERQALPCPPWLDWLLENPYMDTVAGGETILDRLELQPGMRLLDVGCGPGRITLPAAARIGPEGRVLALDVQEEMLRRVQERMARASVDNIDLLHAGIGEGQVPEESFDRALLVTVLGEIPDRAAGLAEIWAALKPGGILSITEVLPDPHYQPRRRVRELAENAGFEEEESFGTWLAFTLNFRKAGDG